MEKSYNLVVKKIPSEWKDIKRGAYVIYIGETDSQAGKRVIIPLRSSKQLNKDKFVRINAGESELVFYSIGCLARTYKMKSTHKVEGSER